MAQFVCLTVGTTGIVYYLIIFSGYFITSNVLGNISDVAGKLGLMFVFSSWFFAKGTKDSVTLSSSKIKKLRKNLKLYCLVFIFLFVVYHFAWPFFVQLLYNHPPLFNLSGLFRSLPYNDLSYLQDYGNQYISNWLRLAYLGGFFAPVVFPCLICFLQARYMQGWRYVSSGHLLQMCFAVPFYSLFSVQEIWYVNHISDGLLRIFPDEYTAAIVAINCFPSMHTSVAFASFLVAQRERNALFRYTWSFFCLSVIVSTFYFPIHWAIDVISGLILGWISVYISDKFILKLRRHFKNISRVEVNLSK